MTFGSVCSGIEAASLAWRPLGWDAAWFSEIDRFPAELLSHRFPKVPNLGDMTRIHERKEFNERTIDVLVGGTPCQSFSVAGLRKGLADPRGNLMLTYLSILERKRPTWMVWENVPGVLSDKENAFGIFLGSLGELGYGFAYRVLNAQYFGVPQRRRRVFVVGHLGDWRRAAAVLFERDCLSGNSKASQKKRKDVAPTLSSRRSGGGGLGGDFDYDGGLVANTVTTREGQRQCPTRDTFVAHSLRGEGFDASEDGTGRGTPLVPVAFDTTQITHAKNRSNPKHGDPCHPLSANAHVPAIAFSCKDYGADASEISPTLRAMGHNESHANAGGQLAVAHAARVRRLTPRECERLQGFPDDYTFIPRGKSFAADGPRYKALGNSMAVPVMRWIGERIMRVSEIGRIA